MTIKDNANANTVGGCFPLKFYMNVSCSSNTCPDQSGYSPWQCNEAWGKPAFAVSIKDSFKKECQVLLGKASKLCSKVGHKLWQEKEALPHGQGLERGAGAQRPVQLPHHRLVPHQPQPGQVQVPQLLKKKNTQYSYIKRKQHLQFVNLGSQESRNELSNSWTKFWWSSNGQIQPKQHLFHQLLLEKT